MPLHRAANGSASVDAYLADQPSAMRAALERVRTIARAAAPGATEAISYRMPALRTPRGVLVWYAGFAAHGSFFPGVVPRAGPLARAAAPFWAGKGTLRFTIERPLPARLITRLVQRRIAGQSSAPGGPELRRAPSSSAVKARGSGSRGRRRSARRLAPARA